MKLNKKQETRLEKIKKEIHCPTCGRKEAFTPHICKKNGKTHCLNCGKPMKKQIDKMTGKKSDYIFHCSCMPEKIDIMIG